MHECLPTGTLFVVVEFTNRQIFNILSYVQGPIALAPKILGGCSDRGNSLGRTGAPDSPYTRDRVHARVASDRRRTLAWVQIERVQKLRANGFVFVLIFWATALPVRRPGLLDSVPHRVVSFLAGWAAVAAHYPIRSFECSIHHWDQNRVYRRCTRAHISGDPPKSALSGIGIWRGIAGEGFPTRKHPPRII